VLSLALNVENERMMCLLVVELRVIPFACTAAIEAIEADVQASWVVDAVEALCAVLAVDALCGCGCAEFCAERSGKCSGGVEDG
jgi:hypothetical protein